MQKIAPTLNWKKIRKHTGAALLAACLCASAANAAKDTAHPAAMEGKDVLAYLQQVISWRHAIVDSDLPSEDARVSLLKDALRNNSQKVLKDSFDFANIESSFLEEAPSVNNNNETRHLTLEKKIEEAQQRIDNLNSQLDELANNGSTAAQREKIRGNLKVEEARLELLNRFMAVFNTNDIDDTGLTGNIHKLSRSVLGDLTEQVPVTAKPATQDAVQDRDGGLLTMMSGLLSLSRKKSELNALISQTKELNTNNTAVINSMRGSLQDVIKQGYELADTPVGKDRKSQEDHKRALDAWTQKYKKMSEAVIPLAEIRSLLDASTNNLKEWSLILDQGWLSIFHRFIIRLAILAVSLVIPFILMELANRAIRRYVKDSTRLRQVNVAKQVVFVALLVLIFFLNFFTEFGSLATYAGFLTAGLAVALQTVLVSLTAHFFFFGRFGVRAGDRVTISGVTGDVIQVGMLRIYLMELIGDKSALRPSGKIVAFPNSVLFSTTAFSKQVSGTNYAWNDLTFILDPKSDFMALNKKILDVVNSVYGEYKKTIERQHIALEQSTHLSVSVPAPRSEIRVKDSGLLCEVHYPVMLENASTVYGQMLEKLMKAFANDPAFKLVLSNPMKIVPVSTEESA
ncbi:MAG TPA: hypothetical protein VFT64_11350 [Rickettsiales bacterium]|nr:hypothetical protein [Rickettsiales bacterium]